MSSTELFKKNFPQVYGGAGVGLLHPNMEQFFNELNEECLLEDKQKKEPKPWNKGKRKPEPDDTGILWCACIDPKLTHGTGRGQALCLLCGYPWYH